MAWEADLSAALPRGLGSSDDRVPGARWALPEELGPEWTYRRSSILLGYRDGKALGSSDDRHLLLVAGSRAGKGVSYVIPNLLLYEGSVFAIDPKGELAQITARGRAERLRQQV